MVQGGMDLVLSGSMGNTAVALIKNKALKPGTVLLELLYRQRSGRTARPATGPLPAAGGPALPARCQRQ